MIKVSGYVKVTSQFEIQLDMTEEQFYAMSERQQNEAIEAAIDYRNVAHVSSEIDDCCDIETV